jgi:outer membrane murein-binding lipoprotein Lpp
MDFFHLIGTALVGAAIFASGLLVGRNNPALTTKLESIASDVKTLISVGVGAVKGAAAKV